MRGVFFANSGTAAWTHALRPWFEAWAREAWKQPKPVGLLAPDSAYLAWIKRQLVQHRIPALGVEFWTPGALRSSLCHALGDFPALAVREDLQLILEIVAGDLPANPIARAAALDPSDFLRICDQLDAAGWGPEALDNPDAQELATAFYQQLSRTHLLTSAQADRELARRLPEAAPPLAQVLAAGFGPAHNGSLHLLRALPDAAESFALCAFTGDEADADLLWRATIESLANSEILPEPKASAPFVSLAQAAANHERVAANKRAATVTLAPNVITESRVILDHITSILQKGEPDQRIGVIFSQAGQPLAREVARLLSEANLGHQDDIGRQPGRSPNQALFEHWARHQERANADSARAFFRAMKRAGNLEHDAERRLRRALEDAFQEAMTGDFRVLAPLIETRLQDDNARHFLHEWPLLPAQATFQEFADRCLPALGALGWPERIDSLKTRWRDLAAHLMTPLPRKRFLHWLAEVCRIPGRTRHPLGREPFAPITLTTVEQAGAQTWDHLIFAGLNREDWPPEKPESLLLDARRCHELNQRCAIPGPAGEGAPILRPGKAPLASMAANRSRFDRQCRHLLSVTRKSANFTAHREKPDEPGRDQDLADWLLRITFAQTGNLPADGELRESATATAQAFREGSEPLAHFPEIARAYQSRRDSGKPFNEYSFCLTKPPAEPLTLSCRAWEDAVRLPAHAWFRHILKVEPEGDFCDSDPRSRALGVWVHQWIRPPAAASPFGPLPESGAWRESVDQHAGAVRERVARAFEHAGRSLPDWWRMDWTQARNQARQFALVLSGQAWPSASGEWNLPRAAISRPAHPLHGLTLTGRIDLVLSDAPGTALNESLPARWPSEAAALIMDFKTGGDEPLKLAKVRRGEGLQLALYAMALHALGAASVDASILRPGEQIEPQVSLDALLELNGLWEGVAAIARTGKFGARGDQQSRFAFTGHSPLAQIPIKASILEAKWRLTHPALADA